LLFCFFLFLLLKLIAEINSLFIYFIPIPNNIIYNILLERISVARLQNTSLLLEVLKRNVFSDTSNYFFNLRQGFVLNDFATRIRCSSSNREKKKFSIYSKINISIFKAKKIISYLRKYS
jgi:hypothetical protein